MSAFRPRATRSGRRRDNPVVRVDAACELGCPEARDLTDVAATLGDREVHVWVVELAAAARDSCPLGQGLSSWERAQMARFAPLRDRRRYALSHAAVRCILAAYLGVDPSELRFQRDGRGKPRVAGCQIEYNLAHSGARALIGVCRDRPLGVDVERVRTLGAADALRSACFTARERSHLERFAGHA